MSVLFPVPAVYRIIGQQDRAFIQRLVHVQRPVQIDSQLAPETAAFRAHSRRIIERKHVHMPDMGLANSGKQ